MHDLKSCPFCGDPMDSFAGMYPESFSQVSDGTMAINCDCGAIGPAGRTMEEAIIAWNRRATTP